MSACDWHRPGERRDGTCARCGQPASLEPPRWQVTSEPVLPSGATAVRRLVLKRGDEYHRTLSGTGVPVRFSNHGEAQRIADQLNAHHDTEEETRNA